MQIILSLRFVFWDRNWTKEALQFRGEEEKNINTHIALYFQLRGAYIEHWYCEV